MQITAARFGLPVMIIGVGDEGVDVRVRDRFVRLAGPDAAAERIARHPPALPELGAPFTVTDLGATWRLSWPGGGCSIKHHSRVTSWGARYAAVVDSGSITVVDSADGRRNRIELRAGALGLDGSGLVTYREHLAIGGYDSVLWIPLADLLEAHGRELDIVVEHHYPLRRPDARDPARCTWVLEHQAVINYGSGQQMHLPRLGIEKGQDLALCDELYPRRYAAFELSDGTRHALELDAPRTFQAKVVRGVSRDPGVTAAPVIVERDERLDRLLRDVAANPDDEAPRLVLADLLQELGEAYGEWLATARVGARPNRHAALGPLAHFLDKVEYRGGLPWSATLVRRVPRDPEVIALAAADLRLGMLSSLRIGPGPSAVYARLVGAPAAIGLRRVDVNEREVIEALIAAQRGHVTHLHDMRFTNKTSVALLAHPTFDRATEVEAFTQSQHVEGLVRRVADDAQGFFARVPRHLWIRDRFDRDRDLVAPSLARWATLPLRQLTVDRMSLRRADGGTIATLFDVGRFGPLERLAAVKDLVAIELVRKPAPEERRMILDALGAGVDIREHATSM